MDYNGQVYYHCIVSKTNTDKCFLYKVSGDVGPTEGIYENITDARNAAKEFDENNLPLFPIGCVGFYSYDGTVNYTELVIPSDYKEALDQQNKIKIPHFDMTSGTQEQFNIVKNTKEVCLKIFSATDRIVLIKPVGYSFTDAQYAQLITNINNVFKMNLPTAIGTYDFDKFSGQWKKIET